MTQAKPTPQKPEHEESRVLIRSRALAAFVGVYLQQRPEPVESNNRTVWAINTAMTVRQLKLVYRQSGVAFAALELHVDMAKDIKRYK